MLIIPTCFKHTAVIRNIILDDNFKKPKLHLHYRLATGIDGMFGNRL